MNFRIPFALGCLSIIASATEIPQERARAVADGFVHADSVGKRLLPDHAVLSAQARGNVWIVHLAPHGYVVVAGSDACEPIVAFSERDFSEPDPNSPFAAILDGASTGCARAEVPTPRLLSVSPRAARWNRLEHPAATLLALSSPPSSATVVAPFLPSHWKQTQPYNDFSPQYLPSDTNDPYRGRTPCGCVATAAAQMMRHWQWPARLDDAFIRTHEFYPNGVYASSENFTIRFDGHVPLDWTTLADSYDSYHSSHYTYQYDLRGHVAESTRFPIARLILLCDVLADMYFSPDGSGADFADFAGNATAWYTPITQVDPQSAPVSAANAMRADIAAGRPILVSLPGHAVIGHGWADDGATQYVYLNYGWGGGNDGWYNLDDSSSDSRMIRAYLGFTPRRKVQLDPLPTVSGASPTLSWHLPPCYADSVNGFTVTATKCATARDDVVEDFSNPSGSASVNGFSIGTTSGDNTSPLLLIAPNTAGTYTLGTAVTLTSRSQLSFRLYSAYALSQTIQIQARFDGGDWTTISTPTLAATGESAWKTVRVYLGGHGGERAEIRVQASFAYGSFYPQAYYALLDDISLTDVLVNGATTTRNVAASARSCTLSGLDAGAVYQFTVTPQIAQAEESDAVSTTIAGTVHAPQPGALSYVPRNLAYNAATPDPAWAISGTGSGTAITTGNFSGGFSIDISGELTSSSTLSFRWQATGYYAPGSAYDILRATFTDTAGNTTTLWDLQNTEDQLSGQTVNIPLAALAGKSGEISVSFTHAGPQYSIEWAHVIFDGPTVSNVHVGVLPEIVWADETKTALAQPQITAVTSSSPAFAEGFYREAAIGDNCFDVACSASVVSLAAYPSHLSLAADSDVTVHPRGGGRFSVEVNPSGISSATADRSRLILTLEATDANGTKAYKDVVLRFSTETDPQSYVEEPSVTIADGSLTAKIPHSWLVDQGLVSAGASTAAFEAAARADADGDGMANWQEYVCGTNPKDSSDKLVCEIAFVNGVLTLSCRPTVLLQGFHPVFRGRVSLTDNSWLPLDTTHQRFFKVFVEQD